MVPQYGSLVKGCVPSASSVMLVMGMNAQKVTSKPDARVHDLHAHVPARNRSVVGSHHGWLLEFVELPVSLGTRRSGQPEEASFEV